MKKYLIALFFLLFSQEIRAEAPKKIGENKGWTVYQYKEKDESVCFLTTSPLSSEGKYTKRSPASLKITFRGTGKKVGEVSFTAGYLYTKESDVSFSIDKSTFLLFTDGDTAWSADEKTDKSIFQALLKGKQLIVDGKSSKGTETKDTFSLEGLEKAFDILCKTCQITR